MSEQKVSDQELWSSYVKTHAPELKERIVKRYLPLVKYVVGRMTVSPPTGLDYEDLLSFGVFGLLDAVERFDLSRGFAFQTFAVPRIRGAILDELRKYDWISRTGREKIHKLNDAIEKVLQDKRKISDDDVMEVMGVDEKNYRETLELASRSYIVSLDEVVELDDGEVSLGGIVADESAASSLEYQDEVRRVTDALKILPEREMQVIAFYYYEGLTLKEIGRILGVTESRVSQIHGKALASVRAFLAGKNA